MQTFGNGFARGTFLSNSRYYKVVAVWINVFFFFFLYGFCSRPWLIQQRVLIRFCWLNSDRRNSSQAGTVVQQHCETWQLVVGFCTSNKRKSLDIVHLQFECLIGNVIHLKKKWIHFKIQTSDCARMGKHKLLPWSRLLPKLSGKTNDMARPDFWFRLTNLCCKS